jgi:hypothetical protein
LGLIVFVIKWFFIVLYVFVASAFVIAGSGMLYGGIKDAIKVEKKNE